MNHMKKKLNLLWNPFIRIAGYQALAWGVVGCIVSIWISYLSKYHYHGLLHFGPAPKNTLLCFALEHLVVWLVPAILFLLGGFFFSKSRIRIVDVFGTVLFAQLPLIFMNLISLLPPMQRMNNMDFNLPPMELMNQPGLLLGIWLALVSLVFLVWTLIWMFHALKVSSNLKGYMLGILYCVGVFGGDILCRLLIHPLYSLL
ncbi:hypothetical protein D0T51_02355 [Parabacteroides sp. 52]|nr:hypothetical protein [Parabacteroides sp. PM5-20]NDV54577.1 hypothetical protein [Parabacteroides sp. 52]